MTDDEINAFLSREERQLLRNFYRREFERRYLLRPNQGMEPFHRQKNIWLWERARDVIWGGRLSPQTRNLWQSARNAYILDPPGELLPLHGAIRLLDIFGRAQLQLATVEAGLSGTCVSGGRLMDVQVMDGRILGAQLPDAQAVNARRPPNQAGERRESGAPTSEFGTSYQALGSLCGELKNLGARLEAILSGVQFELQERRRRHAPGRVNANADGAFDEAATSDGVEAQIARELANYLRIESAIAEHLR